VDDFYNCGTLRVTKRARRQLLSEVWGPSHAADTHYLRIYVKQLREKLEREPMRPRHLVTEIGVGYRLLCDG
jgi:two-component system KDP operon response regulator KdpE